MEKSGFTKTFRKDFRNIKFREDFRTEYKGLKRYFFSDERKKKLERMHPLKKIFVVPWWLLKALYSKLSPFRRFLLLIGILMLLMSGGVKTSSEETTVNIEISAMFGGLIILFILALELKDKLLARTELEEGRAIQLALMPESNPSFPGWDIWLYTKSANDVGGDLLDFIKLNESKVGIAVGDVAGKGLSAALHMAKLQATLRALIYDHPSLTILGEKLNRIFYRDSLPKIFASLIYLEIEPDSGNIRFLNAGHIPPIIMRENKVEQLRKDSPALGFISSANFNEQKISLNKCDFMIIYSDGLTEAQNESGEFYGEEKLKQLLETITDCPSQNLGNLILESVEKFVGTAPVHDDLTLAIIKRL
jgi:serine phosphatase RsbU (regulator of sigma subunit)